MKKLLAFAFILGTYSSESAVLHVTSLNDTGAGTLRDQISIASPGDTIDFSVAGTITINTELVLDSDITIFSLRPDSIELSASGNCRIVNITGGNIYLHGLFLIGGWANNNESGGVIKNNGGNLKMENSEFFSNTATLDGGAIVQDSGSAELIQCYFYNNHSQNDGGAIRGNGGLFQIKNCTFEQNTSDSSGAAISAKGATFMIVNSTFNGNTAGLNGGVADGDSLSFINCTLEANSSSGSAGGVKTSYSYFLNTILWNNSAPIGGNINGTIVSGGHNCIGDTSGITGLDPTDIKLTNPGLDNLTYGAGTTPFQPLMAGSVCIDGGTCMNAPSLDQRDSLRIGFPDIGAYEFGGLPFLPNVLNDTICNGDTLYFDADTITTAGTYSKVFQSLLGCDSTVELIISIATPDVIVTQSGETLTGSPLANSYQWYDCSNFAIIPSETLQSFTAALNGLYAVIISQDGCVDTSICVPVTTVDISSFSKPSPVTIFPSVMKDILNVKFQKNQSCNIRLFDEKGRLVLNENYSNRDLISIDVNGIASGIYFLLIHNNDLNYQTKLVKE
jgi:predicted outer membrane repeat protein